MVAISNWSDELPANEGRGIAFAIYKNSYSAVVAQVKVDENTVLVEHVYSVLDCGLAVDPDGIKAQMTGSIMDGISTVFFNEITYTNSKIDQNKFPSIAMGQKRSCSGNAFGNCIVRSQSKRRW